MSAMIILLLQKGEWTDSRLPANPKDAINPELGNTQKILTLVHSLIFISYTQVLSLNCAWVRKEANTMFSLHKTLK